MGLAFFLWKLKKLDIDLAIELKKLLRSVLRDLRHPGL